MANSAKKKIFFLVFCLASITQGMYSTYFVSILTTIERIYQIQSKTAGAIMSATELGQILGSLLIAYYGGKGNKPKWIAACMTLTAIAALISTSPHFLFLKSASPAATLIANSSLTQRAASTIESAKSPYLTTDLTTESTALTRQSRTNILDQLCYLNNAEPTVLNSTYGIAGHSALLNSLEASVSGGDTPVAPYYSPQNVTNSIRVIFFICLLAIGFGSTAITTLGIPFIDDIVTKEESPLYLGLTIGLRIFGPALGFLLGSFCIGLDVNFPLFMETQNDSLSNLSRDSDTINQIGAWWLGLVIISLPLLILAIPMYYLSRFKNMDQESNRDEFEDITYQAAEDHDIGGSRDFQTHVLTMAGDFNDVTSDRTYYSDVDSSSREVLQAKSSKTSSSNHFHHYRNSSLASNQFSKNITLDQPVIKGESILDKSKRAIQNEADGWRTSCVIVDHFGRLESTNFTNDDNKSLHPSSSSSSRSAVASAQSSTPTMNLSSSLSRLISNRLLLLRILSGILHILPIAGFYTFLPKYLIEQFRIAPASASAISGLAGIMFVGFGAFLGGTIIRVLNVNSKFMTRWIASSALLYAIGMLILMNLGCPENQIVHQEGSIFTSSDCLTTCNCSNSIYNPVCVNETTYMSPCLAGCKGHSTINGKTVYNECGCSILDSTSTVAGGQSTEQAGPSPMVAASGYCSHNCDNLKWYIIIFSIFTLIHASCEVGSMMFNLRCVKSNDRTLALGLITFSSSLLGSIPCSVLYGTVIDLTCIHWDTLTYPNSVGSNSIGGPVQVRGSCRAYKNDTFRYYLHGITALVMLLAFLVDCIISSRAREVDFYDKIREKDEATVELEKSTETI